MKVANSVLLCAALLAESTSAAVRREILNHHTPRQYLMSNSSLPASQQDTSTTTTSVSAEETYAITDATTLSPTSDDSIDSSPTSISSAITSIPFRASTSPPTTSLEDWTSTSDITAIPTTDYDSTGTYWKPNSTITSTARCQSNASGCLSTTQSIGSKNGTFPGNFSIPLTTTSSEQCTPLPSNKPIIQYSIIYTSTTTFYGDSADYTPPFEPITTPYYCTESPILTITTTFLTLNSTITRTILVSPSQKSYTLAAPFPAPTPAPSYPPPAIISISDGNSEDAGLEITLAPEAQRTWRFFTFLTTDKNPSVVFSPQPTPGYSQTWLSGNGVGDGNHRTAEGINSGRPTPITPTPVDSAKLPPQPTFSVTAGGNRVIINDNTVTDLRPGQTTTVVVRSETFTILPTAVVGVGSTITKPPPEETAAPTPRLTSKVLGGVTVTVSGSQAIIGGTTLSIPSKETTTSINGRRVVLASGAVAVGDQTLTFQAPQPSNAIISGGEMLTAIGRSVVVLHSTTITYGPNIPESQTVINGETISIGPRGVSFRGTTVGGPSADATGTDFEIVGGITVAKLPPSLVIVNGATYTITGGNRLQTTTIGNETITIGPSALIISSTSLTYPPDVSVTTTLSPSGTWAKDVPAETGNIGDGEQDDDSAAFSRGPNVFVGVTCLCIAFGVWILG